MKFSTRTTYGLRAMILLADNTANKHNRAVSLSFISEKENISLGYLERLFSKLKKSGLVKSEIGAGGGYYLSRKPSEILVYDIIKTLEGGLAPFKCVDENGKIKCVAKDKCGATDVLLKVQQAVNKTLKSIRLSDLV